MTCSFNIARVALEWWRAGGDKSADRLAELVDHGLYANAISDDGTRAAVHADALANRFEWEV